MEDIPKEISDMCGSCKHSDGGEPCGRCTDSDDEDALDHDIVVNKLTD